MKTVRGSWLIGCVLVAFSASAFAETAVTQTRSDRNSDRRVCYTIIGSSIPQPCERFTGPISTSVHPIDIYGKKPRRGR